MNTTRSVLFALLSLGFLAGCGGDETEDRSEPVVAVTMDELFPRLAGGTFIYYLKGSNTPYTGKVFGWHENGQKRYEGDFKDGEKVEGSDKYWNSKGERAGLFGSGGPDAMKKRERTEEEQNLHPKL
jgi:hypothetical protein